MSKSSNRPRSGLRPRRHRRSSACCRGPQTARAGCSCPSPPLASPHGRTFALLGKSSCSSGTLRSRPTSCWRTPRSSHSAHCLQASHTPTRRCMRRFPIR
eukprot:Amastigsp_a515545_8.p2 type:complete len:100 gc:universal Amastigsp_a515545_8:456-157(-)